MKRIHHARSFTNLDTSGSSTKEHGSPFIGNSSDLAFSITYTCQRTSDTFGNKLKTHFVEFTLKLCELFTTPLKTGPAFLLFYVSSSSPLTLGTHLEKGFFYFLYLFYSHYSKNTAGNNLKIPSSTFTFHSKCFVLYWLKNEPVFVPNLTASLLMAIARHSKAEHRESHTWAWFRISREETLFVWCFFHDV